MKRLKWILPMFAIAILLGGCPYKSEIPLDTKGTKVNTALLGTWEPKSSTDEKYTVTKDNDYTYRIVKTTKSAKEPKTYKAYAVDIDGETFLNLSEAGEMADNGYYIYKMEVNAGGNKVTLTSMTANVTEQFKTGEELRAFIKKYKGLSFFYDKTQDIFNKD